ncbi:MAG: M23 family metallopeptidase [Muribaculaceae bacterium]|nr:M23 family metallopeptidase [Muribaculaceae bacterium]
MFVQSTVDDDTVAPVTTGTPVKSRIMKTDALTAIMEAYSSHDYYSSGHWVRDEVINYPSSVVFPISDIPFSLPESARISSHFGYRAEMGRMHYGTDIAMNVGDTIAVPMDGTVERVGYDAGGYGRYLIIGHGDGMQTRYAHLNKILVREGDVVAAGEAVGLCGCTGNSTGPHLHLEARYCGVPVNPLTVFYFINRK